MSKNEMLAKLELLNEWERIIEEARAEAELIKDEIKAETDTVKVKIGTVGNAVLFAFFVLVVATGILAYYLIHNTKDNIDQQYSELLQNLAVLQPE